MTQSGLLVLATPVAKVALFPVVTYGLTLVGKISSQSTTTSSSAGAPAASTTNPFWPFSTGFNWGDSYNGSYETFLFGYDFILSSIFVLITEAIDKIRKIQKIAYLIDNLDSFNNESCSKILTSEFMSSQLDLKLISIGNENPTSEELFRNLVKYNNSVWNDITCLIIAAFCLGILYWVVTLVIRKYGKDRSSSSDEVNYRGFLITDIVGILTLPLTIYLIETFNH